MRTSAIALSVLLALPVAGAVGCASDPNKQLKQANAEEAKAVQEQRVQRIDAAKDQKVEGIENNAKNLQDQAANLPEGTEQRAKAQSNMLSARQTFQVSAQARLEKADARLIELKRKLEIAGSRAPTTARDRVDQATRDREGVAAELTRLTQARDDQWGPQTKVIESRLNQLDESIADAKTQIDGLMP